MPPIDIALLVCWNKHLFLMIIQIFTEKHFSSNFSTADPQTWLTPHFLAIWEIYILISHWWPINIPKTANEVQWCHVMYFSWSLQKTAVVRKKITWKVVKHIIFKNKNIIAFQWGVFYPNQTSGSEIRAIQMLGDKKADITKKFQPYPPTGIGLMVGKQK